MVPAAFMPRPNRLSCPTSTKFFDVPGVPPPGPTVTLPGGAVTPPGAPGAPDAPAAGTASRLTEATRETNAGRYLIIVTSSCRGGRFHPYGKPAQPYRKGQKPTDLVAGPKSFPSFPNDL